MYSGVPHIRFPFWGEGSLWILGFGVPSGPNPSSGVLKSTLPGPREGSSSYGHVRRCMCLWFGDIRGPITSLCSDERLTVDGLAVFKDAFYLFLVTPSRGGSRGRVRTVVFLQKPGFWSGSGEVIFVLIFILTLSAAGPVPEGDNHPFSRNFEGSLGT